MQPPAPPIPPPPTYLPPGSRKLSIFPLEAIPGAANRHTETPVLSPPSLPPPADNSPLPVSVVAVSSTRHARVQPLTEALETRPESPPDSAKAAPAPALSGAPPRRGRATHVRRPTGGSAGRGGGVPTAPLTSTPDAAILHPRVGADVSGSGLWLAEATYLHGYDHDAEGRRPPTAASRGRGPTRGGELCSLASLWQEGSGELCAPNRHLRYWWNTHARRGVVLRHLY